MEQREALRWSAEARKRDWQLRTAAAECLAKLADDPGAAVSIVEPQPEAIPLLVQLLRVSYCVQFAVGMRFSMVSLRNNSQFCHILFCMSTAHRRHNTVAPRAFCPFMLPEYCTAWPVTAFVELGARMMCKRTAPLRSIHASGTTTVRCSRLARCRSLRWC